MSTRFSNALPADIGNFSNQNYFPKTKYTKTVVSAETETKKKSRYLAALGNKQFNYVHIFVGSQTNEKSNANRTLKCQWKPRTFLINFRVKNKTTNTHDEEHREIGGIAMASFL